MSWKDTIMGHDELIGAYEIDNSTDDHATGCRSLATKQAEISYKAGMQAVVSWSDDFCILHGDSDARIRSGKLLRQGNCYECWRFFKKEKDLK